MHGRNANASTYAERYRTVCSWPKYLGQEAGGFSPAKRLWFFVRFCVTFANTLHVSLPYRHKPPTSSDRSKSVTSKPRARMWRAVTMPAAPPPMTHTERTGADSPPGARLGFSPGASSEHRVRGSNRVAGAECPSSRHSKDAMATPPATATARNAAAPSAHATAARTRDGRMPATQATSAARTTMRSVHTEASRARFALAAATRNLAGARVIVACRTARARSASATSRVISTWTGSVPPRDDASDSARVPQPHTS